jgi:hypothetical protein
LDLSQVDLVGIFFNSNYADVDLTNLKDLAPRRVEVFIEERDLLCLIPAPRCIDVLPHRRPLEVEEELPVLGASGSKAPNGLVVGFHGRDLAPGNKATRCATARELTPERGPAGLLTRRAAGRLNLYAEVALHGGRRFRGRRICVERCCG